MRKHNKKIKKLEKVIDEVLKDEQQKGNYFPFILYRRCKERGMIREEFKITFCNNNECNSCNQFKDAFENTTT